jgi:acylphosphatase
LLNPPFLFLGGSANPKRQLALRYNAGVTDQASIRSEVHYSGRVQGVGFRWNACHVARDFAVTGFVRNLPDGRVQLVAEGERAEVEQFLAEVADSMAGNIRHAQVVTSSATGEFHSFDTAR